MIPNGHPMRRFYILLPLILTLPLAGCPKKDKDKSDDAPSAVTHDDARYIPMGTGDRWVYETSSWLGAPIMVFREEKLFRVSGNTSIGGFSTVQLDAMTGYSAAVEYSRYLRITPQGLWEHFKPDPELAALANPIQQLRFPLVAGDSYVAASQTDLDLGVDLDEDGLPERRDARVVVTVVGQEAVSTPSGDFSTAWKISRRYEWRVHHSTGITTESTEVVDEWLVADVGVVKRDTVYTSPNLYGYSPLVFEHHQTLVRYAVNGTPSETAPPLVKQVYPAAGSINPPVFSITVSFDELLDISAIDADSISLFDENGIRVEGNVAGGYKAFFFSTAEALTPGNYTVRIKNITDVLGNAIAPQEWMITVVSAEDCFDGEVFVCTTL